MGVIGKALTAMTGMSKGDVTQKLLQGLGMDQRSAAYMGALQDMKSGNLVGAHQNMTEALTGFESRGMDSLVGGAILGQTGMMTGRGIGGLGLGFGAMGFAGLPQAHFCGAPGLALGGNVQRIDLKNKRGGLMSALGGAAMGFALGGPVGALVGGALGGFAKGTVSRGKAKCIEKRLNRDPLFRAQFEASVGGRYVPDGRRDGKITVVRQGFTPRLPGLALAGMGGAGFAGMMGNMVSGSVMSGLQRGMSNAIGLASQLSPNGQVMFNGQAMGSGEAQIRAKARPGGNVSKLPNPATFEDLVAAFMMDVVQDMQDEVKKKMAEYQSMVDNAKSKDGAKGSKGANEAGGASAAGAAGGAGRAGRSRGRGGYMGGMLGGIGKLVGGLGGGLLGSIAGPLGTMVGGGLGKALGGMLGGGGVGGLADGVLGMFGGGGGGGLGGILGGGGGMGAMAAGGGGPVSGGGGADQGKINQGDKKPNTEESRQLLFEKLKDLMQKMTQALQSLSNVMNTMHQGSMNAIRNIRA